MVGHGFQNFARLFGGKIGPRSEQLRRLCQRHSKAAILFRGLTQPAPPNVPAIKGSVAKSCQPE
jgi:hypothetical protein